MTKWYYKSPDGKTENGPVTGKVLIKLIHEQKVIDKTLIRKDDSQWVQASQVNGLWDAAKRPTVAFACPHCGKAIDQPPTRCRRCDLTIDKAQGKLVHHDLSAPPKKEFSLRPVKQLRDKTQPNESNAASKPAHTDLDSPPSAPPDPLQTSDKPRKARSWLRWWPPK